MAYKSVSATNKLTLASDVVDVETNSFLINSQPISQIVPSPTIGAFNNTPTPKGLDITNNVISLHAGDSTNPGAITTVDQSISGSKTFLNPLKITQHLQLETPSSYLALGNGFRISDYSFDNTGDDYSSLFIRKAGLHPNPPRGYGCIGIGSESLISLNDSSQYNICIGGYSGGSMTSGSLNCLYGDGAGYSITTGTRNVAFGNASLNSLISGDYNVALGNQAGMNYASNESNNICIRSVGQIGESNTIRIGAGHTTCFISGIGNTAGSSFGRVVMVNAGNTQLGSNPLADIIPRAHLFYGPLDGTTATTLPVAVINTYYLLSLPTTLSAVSLSFTSPSNSRLQYTGTQTIMARFCGGYSGVYCTSANKSFVFHLRKNGVEIPGSQCRLGATTSYAHGGNFTVFVQMSTNDYVEPWFKNVDSIDSLVVGCFNMSCTGFGSS